MPQGMVHHFIYGSTVNQNPRRLAPSSSHENHECLDLFAHHHIVFALYEQGSKIQKNMNTTAYKK